METRRPHSAARASFVEGPLLWKLNDLRTVSQYYMDYHGLTAQVAQIVDFTLLEARRSGILAPLTMLAILICHLAS